MDFPACMPFSSFGESITDTGLDRSEKIFTLAGRHRLALQLGEAALRRPIYSSYGKVVMRKGRKDLFKEEMEILKELLSSLYYFSNGTNQAGFALQKIILVNLNQRLKSRRNEAEEDLIVSGEGIPPLPKWGLNGKADEFWTANDFEILGACYRREVENFLAYLAEHHDFSRIKKDLRTSVTTAFPRKSAINPPTITTVRDRRPAFLEGEPDSISAYLRKDKKTHFNHPVANMNTSVFGHPVQTSSSHAIKELFGITPNIATTPVVKGSALGSQSDDDESVNSRSQRSIGQVQRVPRRGGGDPGDSDGDDSGSGGGNNGPRGGSRKPLTPSNPRKNPFDTTSAESAHLTNKPPAEAQFDVKLKLNAIPSWDGNPENLRRWLLKINSLAKRSETVETIRYARAHSPYGVS